VTRVTGQDHIVGLTEVQLARSVNVCSTRRCYACVLNLHVLFLCACVLNLHGLCLCACVLNLHVLCLYVCNFSLRAAVAHHCSRVVQQLERTGRMEEQKAAAD